MSEDYWARKNAQQLTTSDKQFLAERYAKQLFAFKNIAYGVSSPPVSSSFEPI